MRKILTLISIVGIIACGDARQEGAMSKTERLDAIQELEDIALGNADNFDTATAIALVKNYDLYATENPEDEMSPNYLYKAVNYSSALNKPNQALGFLDRIINDYPDFDKKPYCMFLKGFIYEDYLNDLENAESSYRAFIKAFPDHNMTDAAKFSLKNLGKSPEELIQEFESKSDSTQVES